MSSTLRDLAEMVGGSVVGDDQVVVDDVVHDSRAGRPRALFVAIRGATSDGHSYLDAAAKTGVGAVCVDHIVELGADRAIPQLVVADTRSVMGKLAARVHGDPSQRLKVIGVTGTNGKTTVTHNIESISVEADLLCGLIGTIETRVGDRVFASDRTTPESADFQRLLAEMAGLGCQLVAAEVSSHALALDRVAATRFEVAAFTNLSQDHLDFHGDMDTYLAAKATLFTDYEVATAVINVDDPVGADLARLAEGHVGSVIRVGDGGEVRAADRQATTSGSVFTLESPWGSSSVDLPVVGSFNIDNAVVAAVCALAAGVDFQTVVSGLHSLRGVPGRFEKVSGDDPVTVLVDYAHTPDGVRVAVENARRLDPGKLVVLVGAGGDRDREKRPMMGRAASEADLVVVTSDNPRSEDPDLIVESVLAGVRPGVPRMVDSDRRRAISLAIGAAVPGDVVLLLGRGHEPFQEIAGAKLPFDDRQVARAELAELRSSTNSESDRRSMAP